MPDDAQTLDALREFLLPRVDAMLGTVARPTGLNPYIHAELFDRRIAGDRSDIATLAKLFLFGRSVPVSDATRALTPISLDILTASGLATIAEDWLQPSAVIRPHLGLLVASDPISLEEPMDSVPPPGAYARRLAHLTLRQSVAYALDLGTGTGIQAVLAARHCAHVVAVDLNERALAFARFNARLNGVSNVEFRSGNWFEPVAGERFDLIVANAPFVVSPDTLAMYRDSGFHADGMTEKLVREAPAHLSEGGFAYIIGNWIHRRHQGWHLPLEAWLSGCQCDALFLKYATRDPVSYAVKWCVQTVSDGAASFLQVVDRWRDDFSRQGVEAISDGVLVLRRRAGTNWVRALEVPAEPTRPTGDHVLRIIAARDRRGIFDDDEVLRRAYCAPAPGLSIVSRAGGDSLSRRSATLELEDGIGFAATVTPRLADLLLRLDTPRRVANLEPDQEILDDLRRLFALGFVSLAV